MLWDSVIYEFHDDEPTPFNDTEWTDFSSNT